MTLGHNIPVAIMLTLLVENCIENLDRQNYVGLYVEDRAL